MLLRLAQIDGMPSMPRCAGREHEVSDREHTWRLQAAWAQAHYALTALAIEVRVLEGREPNVEAIQSPHVSDDTPKRNA